MFRTCCVPKCSSERKDITFHNFPSKKETRELWLKCINCIKLKTMDKVVNKAFVCHKHFEKRFTTASNRLKIGAYPSLFSPSEISSGTPSNTCYVVAGLDSEQNESASPFIQIRHHFDHTYCASAPSTNTRNLNAGHPSTSTTSQTSNLDSLENKTSPSEVSVQVEGTSAIQLVEQIVTSTPSSPKDHKKHILPTSPQRFSKKKLIRDVSSLTPKCKLLYKEFKKMRRQRNFNERAKKALDFSKEKSFEKLTNNMNPLAKKLLWMQVKLCTQKKQGRRFTMEEKIIGLSVYKQSPKSYKFLQKIFILPSKTTLKKMISNLKIDAGINTQIFELIKEQVNNWNEQKKLCTIMFDEMALEPAVTYISSKDEIDGFVHLKEKTNKLADHALVFMLRGAVHKWQQPIAYYFCEGQTKTIALKGIIKDVVAAVSETGLKPIALVSDQGTTFQSALNGLLQDTKRDQIRAGENVDDTIHLCGHSMSIIYDPPHLIKGMRNNLLSKDVVFEGKTATWQDIVDVYNTDCSHGESRIMHKLTDEHVVPGKIKKMKVKNCVRVFSKTVSAALSYTALFPLYPNGEPVSKTLKNTSEFISFMDDLFDSVNGATFRECKHLRRVVTSNSRHHSFWTDAIKKLKNLKFLTKEQQQKSVPSLKNWILTLKSFKRLWQHLNTKENIKIMRPRYFNSDPIENFFGQVRAYNYRSNDPSVSAFKNTFKSLLITRFINFHSESYNCEDDAGDELLSIQTLFKIINKNDEKSFENEPVEPAQQNPERMINNENIQIQARRERLNVHSRAYTVGWVTRKILNKIKCKTCKNNLVASNEDSSVYEWIKTREYESLKKRKLNYPTENAVRYFGIISQETNDYLEQNAFKNNICSEIQAKIKSDYTLDFINCEFHKTVVLESFLSISIKLFIFNWCNIIISS